MTAASQCLKSCLLGCWAGQGLPGSNLQCNKVENSLKVRCFDTSWCSGVDQMKLQGVHIMAAKPAPCKQAWRPLTLWLHQAPEPSHEKQGWESGSCCLMQHHKQQ